MDELKKALIISNKIRKVPGGSVETIIEPLRKKGFDVFWAANFDELKIKEEEFPCKIIKTNSETNPFSFNNIKTRKTILEFLKNNKVDLIFCSTPIGGVHGRLCGKKMNVPTIIYQAHGFLFFNGGPKLGFFYKLVEKWLAHFTDALITINQEDYLNAKKFKLRTPGNVFLVNGCGEDYSPESISQIEKTNLKETLNIRKDDYVFISIGELNKNKNVVYSVRAFYKAFKNNDTCKLIICGEGKESKKIKRFVLRKRMNNVVSLLGYRTDVKKLLQISNCYVSTSLREGLSRTVGESMSSGLICIVSNKRGLKDWIDNKGGFLVEPKNVNDIAKKMINAYEQRANDAFGSHNKEMIKMFSSDVVKMQMVDIFNRVL